MKKKTFLTFFLSLFFCGFIAISCGDDDDNNNGGNNNGGGGETIDTIKQSLEGSNYYLVTLDGKTYEKIKSKVVKDYRPNEADIALNIWGDTYKAGTPAGPNIYSEVEGWVSLIVKGGQGWSGCGFINNTGADLKGITSDYTLHLAIKAKHTQNIVIRLRDGNDTHVGYTIGDSDFNDNGTIYPKITNFKRDGEWHQIEIPMNKFLPKLNYSTISQKNIVEFLSGPVDGTTLDVDAIFIYKKK